MENLLHPDTPLLEAVFCQTHLCGAAEKLIRWTVIVYEEGTIVPTVWLKPEPLGGCVCCSPPIRHFMPVWERCLAPPDACSGVCLQRPRPVAWS